MSADQKLIFDLGACTTKIGFAGEDFPHLIFDTICGEPKPSQSGMTDPGAGPAAAAAKLWSFDKSAVTNPAYTLRRPLEFGGIRDWEAWEELVSHCYLQLERDPAEQPVFMTEAHRNQRDSRERTLYHMFETFRVPAFFMASQAVLALYAGENPSGLIVHIGDGTADLVPYLHGQAKYLEHASTNFDVCGSDVTERMAMLLGRERGYQLYHKSKLLQLRDLKETQCYVSANYDKDLAKLQYASKKLFESSFQLQDRSFVDVGAEKFMAPEILFRPSVDSPGIHEAIVETIKKCDLVTRFELYSDIVLVGGGTMISGLRDRLEHEIKTLVPGAPVHVRDHPYRHLLPWKGASFVAQLPTFDQASWVTRGEYEEFGEAIVHRKCNMN